MGDPQAQVGEGGELGSCSDRVTTQAHIREVQAVQSGCASGQRLQVQYRCKSGVVVALCVPVCARGGGACLQA